MELSIPLVSLFGRIDGAVLTVLARGSASLNGRQVQRLLGGAASIKGVHAALQRLASTGLVSASARQAETLYRANREHLLWDAVEAALHAPVRLRRRISEFSAMAAPEGAAVLLYGSVERGEASGESDVDLLVVHHDDVSRDLLGDFVFELSRNVANWTGNQAQVVTISRSELTESAGKGDALVDLWLNDSQPLHGSISPLGR